jgi:hypothetical protein
MVAWFGMKNIAGWAVATTIVCHLLLSVEQPLWLPAVAALVLAGLLPGLLLVEVLFARSPAPPTSAERILYSIAAGYGVMVLVMLLVSYLPGEVARWQTLLAFDLTLLLLLVALWWRGGLSDQYSEVSNQSLDTTKHWSLITRYWILPTGLLLLLLVGGLFRLTNLGYSEFQGDEARAALRAAAVIQGYEDVLFIHKKGPTEILLPTLIYSLTGHLTELTARLPFALANLASLFAIFLLGWWIFGPLAGWAAAFLLAFDGYLVGFSHIVQYQSIILLTSALVVQIIHRLYVKPIALGRYLSLAAFLLATGLLSHYEAATVLAPVAVLLGAALYNGRIRWATLLRAALPAIAVGGSMLALFYIPFVLHPNFAATYTYLVDRRIGGEEQAPYNNLNDFFIRTTTYNSSYFALVMIALVVAALILAYRRGLPARWANGVSVAILGVLALTFWRTDWLRVGEIDLIVAPFALAMAGVWILPGLRTEERATWLWFGAPLLLAFFLIAKPRSHVYIFFTPWALLAGSAVAAGWQWLRQRSSERTATLVGGLATAAAILVFAPYVYWLLVHNQVEVLRTWPENRPAGYWVPYSEPDDKALFGFPLANGWKVVGALYEQGVIQGDFETNEKEAWVPAWYTRGQERCAITADWYFQIDNLEPFTEGNRLSMEHYLRSGFEKWAQVEINGTGRMVIYKRTGARLEFPTQQPADHLPRLALNEFAPTFDLAARPAMTLTYPSVAPPISHPLHVNLGDQIWLEGYDIRYPQPLRAGDVIRLTLYWRAQQPIAANYKVFNQAYYGEGVMVAQQDGYPLCGTRATWQWDPGELVADEYELRVKPDAPDGLYPLFTGLYLEETMERLPVLDEDGHEVGNQIHLTDIRMGEE